MALSVGIVGLPNVGKSTLFNALLKRQVALAANYPFATIEPNTGIVEVPDERLAKLAEIVGSEKIVPAVVKFVDIAGLVAGASQGEGLGNKFLAHIREVDLIVQVIRAFEDAAVMKEGAVDPVSDMEVVETELLLADLATLIRQKEPRFTQDREEKERWQVVAKLLAAARKGQQIRNLRLSEGEAKVARELGLLTAKPMIYGVNIDDGELAGAEKLAAEYGRKLGVGDQAGEGVIVFSAQIESELASLSESDQVIYMKELGIEESGLERLVAVAYKRLGLLSFLTAGEPEVKAWTVRQGATAPEAAGVIHSDFEHGFIKAKVCSYDDFVELGGWGGVRETGKLRLEGKDYVVREGDIVEFMFGV